MEIPFPPESICKVMFCRCQRAIIPQARWLLVNDLVKSYSEVRAPLLASITMLLVVFSPLKQKNGCFVERETAIWLVILVAVKTLISSGSLIISQSSFCQDEFRFYLISSNKDRREIASAKLHRRFNFQLHRLEHSGAQQKCVAIGVIY